MALSVAPRQRQIGRAPLIPLGTVFLAVGIASALVLPFQSLFLTSAVHAGTVEVSVYLIVAPLSGVVFGTALGRLSDRYPIRRRLLIGAALCGLVGFGLTAFVRDYRILLALTTTASAMAGVLYPQMFAYARQALTRYGHRTAMATSGLRSVFSVAWVAGPPLAALLLRVGGFGLLYATSAAMYVAVALVVTGWLPEIRTRPAADRAGDPPGGTPEDGAREDGAHQAGGTQDAARRDGGAAATTVPRWMLLSTAAAFTVLQSPLTLGSQVLPLFIDANLHGAVTDAGLILGVCAALEVPLLLGLGILTTRVRLRTLLLAGACCGVLYNAVAATATTVWALGVAQVLNAALVAAVSGVGITYMQDMRPLHPGRATTLFTNSFPVGAVLAGPLIGLAQQFGYRLAYVFGTGLCLLGFVILAVARPRVTGSSSAGPPR